MSDNQNNNPASGQNQDPGKFSQRGTHVDEPGTPTGHQEEMNDLGRLKADSKADRDPSSSAAGDSSQDGTQNDASTNRTSDSGAGSGNLAQEEHEKRSDKFGWGKRNDETGL